MDECRLSDNDLIIPSKYDQLLILCDNMTFPVYHKSDPAISKWWLWSASLLTCKQVQLNTTKTWSISQHLAERRLMATGKHPNSLELAKHLWNQTLSGLFSTLQIFTFPSDVEIDNSILCNWSNQVIKQIS